MSSRIVHSALCALLTLCCLGGGAFAGDRMDRGPAELEGVGLTEKLGDALPLFAEFSDESGKKIRLGDLINDKPVILTFNYSNCPMLCSVQLGGLVDVMIKMDWSIGDEFEVITIGLDPDESMERAATTKEQYLERYGRKGAGSEKGWHFLRGDASSIKLLADSVGFGYRYYPQRKEYLHPAVMTFVSPRGSVSGYMYGIKFNESEIQDKLIVANTGDISESLTQFILSCYHLESGTGNGIAAGVMKYGGLLFLIGFAFAMAIFGIKRSAKKARGQSLGSIRDHV